MTGARSRLTPASFSSRPHSEASRCSVPEGSSPWATADGIAEKPGPRSRWTSPPSWSAAMKNRTRAVAAEEATAWSAAVTCRTSARLAVLVVPNIMEPK